ncbi:RNA polymerase sigma factor [Kordiimonas sp. SCSIO 12610]|uniref:RNA polymerase sigma factor n=1 Tax=Kordiimonas sp. SCSIO 12610 TaxID=2829597 RepID=UPI00210AA684|nr:sigma-70 family RNA polymerase sigma factor [Kordiimonas sp. SCSIO 12610]UTW54489.1 sigma-70 family RNA polymerase sigma factor [Kordiimonas sp. SCSIO 12610]
MATAPENSRTAEKILVLKAQTGDVKAFEVLYRAYLPSLVGFARRLSGDDHMAEDAVQDAWITISKTINRLKEPEKFRAWVFKTVRWRLIDLARRKGKGLVSLDDVQDGLVIPHDRASIEARDLRTLIKALPSAEQDAVYLFYLEGFSVKEISDVLNVPIGTVKSRLNRARTNLREAYIYDENK